MFWKSKTAKKVEELEARLEMLEKAIVGLATKMEITKAKNNPVVSEADQSGELWLKKK